MSDKDLAERIESVSNSLQAEMHQMRQSLQAEMQQMRTEWREHAERIENSVDRHSKMITSGTLAIGGLNRSASQHDRAIKDLQARVRTLERQKRRKKG